MYVRMCNAIKVNFCMRTKVMEKHEPVTGDNNFVQLLIIIFIVLLMSNGNTEIVVQPNAQALQNRIYIP